MHSHITHNNIKGMDSSTAKRETFFILPVEVTSLQWVYEFQCSLFYLFIFINAHLHTYCILAKDYVFSKHKNIMIYVRCFSKIDSISLSIRKEKKKKIRRKKKSMRKMALDRIAR
jgi:hypothetical protein